MLALVLNLGISGSLTYFTASKKFAPRELFSFSIIMASVLGFGGGTLFYFAYRGFLSRTFLTGSTNVFMLMAIAALPVNLLASYLTSILLGQQQMIAVNAIDLLRIFSNLLLQYVCLLLGWGVGGAIGAWLAANVLALLLVLGLSRRYWSIGLAGTSKIIQPAFIYGVKNYVANLFSFFNYRLDSFLVNYFAGLGNLGQYSTGVTVAELLWYIPNAISSALFPKASTLEAKTAAQLTAQTCRVMLMIILPLAVLFGLVGKYAIIWVYTQDFAPAVSPFVVLLPGMVGVAVSKVISASLSGHGKPQYATYTSAITAILTVVLDLILIPLYDINGAALASSIAYLASAILSITWFSRETKIAWRHVVIPTFQDVLYLRQQGNTFLAKIFSDKKQ